MIALMLFLQSQAEIVVTGQRLVEVQEQCAKSGCTPLRDAQATIALAEVRFRDGNYQEAKRLLAAGTSRNESKAAEAPRAVAALYEAYATVALHEGSKADYRRATAKQVEILRDNLPPDDPAVLAASTVLGDMWIELQRYHEADAAFASAEKSAEEAGLPGTAFLANMKRIWIMSARGEHAKVQTMLEALEQRPIAQKPAYITVLRVMRLRLAARGADEAEINRLVAQIGEGQDGKPVLISAPPYEDDPTIAANKVARSFGGRDAVPMRSNDVTGIRWADVGFWIRPDGRTADVEVLRGVRSRKWLEPALNQIAGRRYSAGSDTPASGQGVYRVERFTLRTEYAAPIGSLIARRGATGGYDVLDMTDAPAAPPVS